MANMPVKRRKSKKQFSEKRRQLFNEHGLQFPDEMMTDFYSGIIPVPHTEDEDGDYPRYRRIHKPSDPIQKDMRISAFFASFKFPGDR